jgi:hypothetical protein
MNCDKDEFIVDYIIPRSHDLSMKIFTRINTIYDKQYNKRIIEHSSDGGSVETFAGSEHIDPDAMMNWCDEKHKDYQPTFKACVKIALSAEFLYWKNMQQAALKDMDEADIARLPTINRQLAQLEKTLLSSGLRASLYKYHEPDKPSDDDDAVSMFDNMEK